MAAIQYEKYESTFTILNPFNGFAEEEHRVEVRKDPLLRDTSVYNPFLKDKAKAFFGQNDQELLARLIDDPAGSCIFCGENARTKTGRYPEGLIPGGRLEQGEAGLFANLFSLAIHHPVIVLSKAHFLSLSQFSPPMLGENLGTKRIYKIKTIVVTKVRVVVTERLDVPQIRSLYVTRTGIKAMDKHPPAPPTGLTGALVDGGHTIKLSWTQPATSPDSGIARYAVYRGETRIGESTATEYSDRGLPEQTAYRYPVSVIRGCGLESVRTAECAVTTPKDTEPPVLLGIKQVNATQLVAQFSEPIEEASAPRAGNSRLDQGATVTAAVRGSDLSTVIRHGCAG